MIRLLNGMPFPGAPDADLQLQQAGFDLTVQSVAAFVGEGSIDLTNQLRRLPDIAEIPWQPGGGASPGMVTLQPGGYLVTYNEEIGVPADCAGVVLPRSTLMRCGATLHSALWDPGYIGRGQGLMTVYNTITLHRDARIGQFVLIRLEEKAKSLYEGKYQGENL